MAVLKQWALFVALLSVVGCGKPTSIWIEQIKDPDPAKRLHAIHELQGKVNEAPTVAPALVTALRDENHYVRRDAARALGNFGPGVREAASAPLAVLLKDDEPSVRKAAGEALRRIDPEAAAK